VGGCPPVERKIRGTPNPNETDPRMKPTPPKHLSRKTKGLYRRVLEEYELEPHHTRILQLLCEALDRAEDAQRVIDEDGITTKDRFGQLKPHPAVAIKRDAEVAAARLLRELDLEGEPDPSPRPPALRRNR
jgi:P27 family predicted phage terminase small subunit